MAYRITVREGQGGVLAERVLSRGSIRELSRGLVLAALRLRNPGAHDVVESPRASPGT